MKVDVDISGISENKEIEQKKNCKQKQRGISSKSLVKIVLTGEIDLESEVDIQYLLKEISR